MGALALIMAAEAQAASSVPVYEPLIWEIPDPLLAYPSHGKLYAEASLSSTTRDDFHRGVIIADDELDQMRAGFNIGGLDVDFGARLQTLIDNSIELVSVVNFTRAGANVVSQTFRNPAGAANRVGPGTGLSVTDMTPGGVDLTGLANFSGITLNDPKGFTAALHNITRNAIVSGVVNNASGRDIQQRIDIDVHLNNIGALRAAKQRASIIDSFSGILR